MIDLPVSTKITMRPVWARRQRRHYMQDVPRPPELAEIEDAIKVMRDPDNLRLAPALYNEALLILKEATSGKDSDTLRA